MVLVEAIKNGRSEMKMRTPCTYTKKTVHIQMR